MSLDPLHCRVASSAWSIPTICSWLRLVMGVVIALPIAAAGEATIARDAWKKILADGQTAVPGNTERWEVESGSFVIASDMPNEPSLTCYYAVPATKDGRISPRRNRAVYFFHTPNPKSNVLDNGLCNRLVTDLGVSVFGIAFKASSQAGLFYGNRESQQRFYAFAHCCLPRSPEMTTAYRSAGRQE